MASHIAIYSLSTKKTHEIVYGILSNACCSLALSSYLLEGEGSILFCDISLAIT